MVKPTARLATASLPAVPNVSKRHGAIYRSGQSIRVGGGIFRVGDVSNIRISGGQYQGIVISSGT